MGTVRGSAVGANFEISWHSNACNFCSANSLDLKPSANLRPRRALACESANKMKKIARLLHQIWGKPAKIRLSGPKTKSTTWPTEPKYFENHYLRWGCWRGNVVLFCSFCVNAARRCRFRTFCRIYAITKKKREKTLIPRQQRNDENRNFPTGYRVGRAGWSSVSWAYGRLGCFLVCFNYWCGHWK